jgi:hypothetical protein
MSRNFFIILLFLESNSGIIGWKMTTLNYYKKTSAQISFTPKAQSSISSQLIKVKSGSIHLEIQRAI